MRSAAYCGILMGNIELFRGSRADAAHNARPDSMRAKRDYNNQMNNADASIDRAANELCKMNTHI